MKPIKVRHHAGVGGRVFDAASEKPLPGARVTLAGKRGARGRETEANPAGLYYFLDLEDGTYEVQAWFPGGGTRRGTVKKQVKVALDPQGSPRTVFLDLPLQATTVRGVVTAAGERTGIAMAEVRVKGSGERTFTDSRGQYWLRGIETGRRNIEVAAQGFRKGSKEVRVDNPGVEQALDFALAAAAVR